MKTYCIALFILFAFDAVSQAVERPAYNTSTGFFVKAGKIYDSNGVEFIPLGVNGAVFWGSESNARNSIPLVRRASANSIRLVSVTPRNYSWSWFSNHERQRELVDLSVKNQLVPMLEFHDATCGSRYEDDPQGDRYNLKHIVDYWCTPELVKICQDYEQYLIVNIANEWGKLEELDAWVSGYKTAITRMREAGIRNMLVIDAGGHCGQYPNSIISHFQELLDHDPEKNVVFSIHMYGFWYSGTVNQANWRFQVEQKLTEFKQLEIPLIIGEFGWSGTQDVSYDPKVVMAKSNELGYGWYFWSWFDTADKPYYSLVKNYATYNGDNDLTAAGLGIINGPNGFKKRAVPSSVFGPVLSADREQSQRSITLYPNPAGNILKVYNPHKAIVFEIIDTKGRVITTGTLGTNENNINLENLPPAVYFFHVDSANVQQRIRFVKK